MRTLLLVLVLAVAGCGSAGDGGSACKLNSDCDPGLSCVAPAAIGSGGCVAAAKSFCTKQCVSDAECLTSVPVCVTSCSGLKLCAK